MKIVVCIKQVPETTEVKIDPETNRIIREGVKGIINPFDTYAIEETVRLKERLNAETVAISMGPPQAESALRETISMGIDEAILISDKQFIGSDTLATSYVLNCAIKKIKEFDLIICGMETFDGSTGQVGPELAENLDIPCISYVSKIVNMDNGEIECKRLMEDHYETVKSSLPVLITVIKEINEPRIPSLRGLLKAKKAEIKMWNSSDLNGDEGKFGHDGSPTTVIECWGHEIQKDGKKFEGEPEELVEIIHDELKKLGVV